MYDWSLCARKFLLSDFIVMNIMGSGTKYHHETFLKPFRKGKAILVSLKRISVGPLVLYKSSAQTCTVILIELSINFPGISLLG